jgi:large subunit ribosomal protein L5e
MTFVKVVKNKAYFKKYQVKFRRRRDGFTDYRQRHKLITQDKNKYGSPKYRLVVRFSNKYVLAQIVSSEIIGDRVLCAASSKELEHHGLTLGLKNYSAAYATGLLVARRLLTKLGLNEAYPGVEEVTGEVVSTEDNGRTFYVDELDEEKKPFRCLLDVGIKNTTTGARVFAVLKGAADGGLDIPHNHKRFPGYNRDTDTFEAEVHRDRIFGEHVAEYMREMEEDDEEMFKRHFASYIEEGVTADDLEELYEKVHESIRENPEAKKAEPFVADKSFKMKGVKKTYEARKADVAAKKAALRNGDADDE